MSPNFSILRHSLVALACRWGLLRNLKDTLQMRSWYKAGKPVPPPHTVKQRIVSSYASAFGAVIFIETGTYFGDMDYAVKDQFNAIVSIELSQALWRRAVSRFRAYPHIQIRLGSSGEILPDVLKDISSNCLFWLDGHYSGGITAKGSTETPVVKEVMTILGHKIKNHVILIDDARCFDGMGDYPTLEELRELIALNRPDCEFLVLNDVIRIHPHGTVQCEL